MFLVHALLFVFYLDYAGHDDNPIELNKEKHGAKQEVRKSEVNPQKGRQVQHSLSSVGIADIGIRWFCCSDD